MRWLVIVAALAACRKAPAEASRTSSETTECESDDDCVLLPSALTCCVECPPAPPFEAAAVWVLDGMLIEQETVCAEGQHCPEVDCEPLPVGCVARAACAAHRCVVVASGCDLPTT